MKIAFVISRYGPDVNGGAELHCKHIAEHLSNFFETDVITTCANDYVTWKNVYPEGTSTINNVNVIRFKTDFERTEKFHALYQKILGVHPEEFEKRKCEVITNILKTPENIQEHWMIYQGPYSSRLFEYLKSNHHRYDLIIFFTYLYPTTYFGIQIAPEKSILVPTAHDEPAIYFPIFNKVFTTPKAIIYNTPEEKEFINSKFQTANIVNDVVGTGIDLPKSIGSCGFKNKFKIETFIIYIGRIDEGKGCNELFQNFIRFKRENKSGLKLVLLGKPAMQIPNHPDIIHLGFLSDQDKFNALAGAKLLIMPSRHESLSMVLLEAWLCSIPVLVNGECEVLKGQCKRANGGLWFTNYDEFEECVQVLLNNDRLRNTLGVNGKNYVINNYSWPIIEKKYLDILSRIRYSNEVF
jgi:glycosyltransferase involved in cell wall biosynthesis